MLRTTVTVIVTALIAAALSWRIGRPDFAILWGAMRLSAFYDWPALAQFLGWPLERVAFVYPPSALPILAPFALLPMRFALCAWAAISGGLLAAVTRSWAAPPLLFAPAVLWALPGGQTTVLLGSVLFASFLLLQSRPACAGVLLGFALALKPQLAVVVPLALLINRQWKPIIAAVATFLCLTVLSAMLFGVGQWIEWARHLQPFLDLHQTNPALRRAELAFGLPLWVRAILIGSGAYLVSRTLDDSVSAFCLAIAFALLGAPHAMGYELALLAPVYIALARRESVTAAVVIVAPFGLMAYPVLRPFGWVILVTLIAALVVPKPYLGRSARLVTDH